MPSYSSHSHGELRRLLAHLNSRRRQLGAAVVCSVLNKTFDLAPPVLIALAVDVVVREQTSWLAKLGFISVPKQLVAIAVISFLVWSAESLFEYLYGLLWRNLAQTTQHELRLEAYNHLQQLEISFIENDNSGRLLSVLSDDINQLERFLDHGANAILQLGTTVVLVGGAMILTAPSVAILAFLPIPVILWGSLYFQGRLGPRYREVRQKAGDIAAFLANNLGGMLTIKSFANETQELERLRAASKAYQHCNSRAIRLSAAFIPLIRFAILFAFLAILLLGGLQAWQGKLDVGTYSFLVFITQRLLWPLTTLGHVFDDYQRSMASTRRVLDLIDTPITIAEGSRLISPEILRGEINFCHVNFAYAGREPLMQNFCLHVPAGGTLGIVGATGSGKSTLVKLLLRLYPMQGGKITLDGLLIDSIRLQDLRRCIALVSQEVYLFEGTIAENIAYGNAYAGAAAVRKAAVLAEAVEFIEQLPQGFDTLVGERGQRLSGGQRQRIALARAIIKQAPVLILDEATAAVDNETEAAIQRSLKHINYGRTTLIIAHRLSTVQHADQIIVMEHGQITEKGAHNQLIHSNGTYAKLWRAQADPHFLGMVKPQS